MSDNAGQVTYGLLVGRGSSVDFTGSDSMAEDGDSEGWVELSSTCDGGAEDSSLGSEKNSEKPDGVVGASVGAAWKVLGSTDGSDGESAVDCVGRGAGEGACEASGVGVDMALCMVESGSVEVALGISEESGA